MSIKIALKVLHILRCSAVLNIKYECKLIIVHEVKIQYRLGGIGKHKGRMGHIEINTKVLRLDQSISETTH